MARTGRWQVWAVDIGDGRALAVDEGTAVQADASADTRNKAAAKLMPAAQLVFVPLPVGQQPDLAAARRLLADRIDSGYWKVWEVAPDVARATVLGGGSKTWSQDNAADRNTTTARHPILAGVVYLALPDGQQPDMDAARELLAVRSDGIPVRLDDDLAAASRGVPGVVSGPADPAWVPEVLTVKALAQIRGGLDAIPMLEAAAAALRARPGERPGAAEQAARDMAVNVAAEMAGGS